MAIPTFGLTCRSRFPLRPSLFYCLNKVSLFFSPCYLPLPISNPVLIFLRLHELFRLLKHLMNQNVSSKKTVLMILMKEACELRNFVLSFFASFLVVCLWLALACSMFSPFIGWFMLGEVHVSDQKAPEWKKWSSKDLGISTSKISRPTRVVLNGLRKKGMYWFITALAFLWTIVVADTGFHASSICRWIYLFHRFTQTNQQVNCEYHIH